MSSQKALGGFLALAIAALFVVSSCTQSNAPAGYSPAVHPMVAQAALDHVNSDEPPFIQNAIAVQNRHHSNLMSIHGVVGTGVGVDDNNPNQAVVLVFTDHDGVAGVPSDVEGTKTRIEMIGKVTPFSQGYTGTYRPVQCGVSVGNNNECASGTIGCLVDVSGTHYMLSNNHVFARENSASIGEQIDQPGRYDKQCGTSGSIGSLAAFNTISFTSNNSFDAAIASLGSGVSFSSAEASGYTPSSTTVSPTVGLAVKKTGRTSGLTTGKIAGINVTITVGYTGGNATFVGQIYVKGQFIKAGDSGSLMVTQSGNYPVGLDFAGSSTASFANPIGPILTYFGATVVSN
jgi:hypothetical protein